jgi:hypothetical protein
MLKVTCFASSLDEDQPARSTLTSAFPNAIVNLMEAQRLPADNSATCEGAGRLEPGAAATSNGQQAIVKTPKIVFSGIQMAFGSEDSDLRLAFDRLEKAVASTEKTGRVVAVRFYTMDRSLGQKLPLLAKEIFHQSMLESSRFQVEALPSLDATMGMDLIAEAAN